MDFRSRIDQTIAEPRLVYNFSFSDGSLSDETLDGMPLARTTSAIKWIKENTIHQALRLTTQAATTAPFLSTQVTTVRDEVRNITHVATQEVDGLYLTKVRDVQIIERRRVSEANVSRYSICLRKYDGEPIAIYSAGSDLFLNGKQLNSSARRPDFVSISIDQPPIGNFATVEPRFGAISYKCRESGALFIRQMDPMTLDVGAELTLPNVRVLGGGDIVCFDGKLFIRVDALTGGRITPSLATMNMSALAVPAQYSPIDLGSVPHNSILPAMSCSSIDHTGNYHVPVVVRGEKDTLIDVLPNDNLAVASIEAPFITSAESNVFPSKPGIIPSAPGTGGTLRLGFGDGVLDGNGIIASVVSRGDLYSSNSQSGGYSYPNSSLLNHDMPKVFSFRATQCYTRGATPDTVSMDYIFIEADDDGHPLDSTIWLETWDMPLPKPELTAKFDQNKIVLRLLKQGWFFPGKTTVELSDKSVSIGSMVVVDGRTLEIAVDRPPTSNATVSFHTKSEFYYHSASTQVSR